jgi:hypothetical protein
MKKIYGVFAALFIFAACFGGFGYRVIGGVVAVDGGGCSGSGTLGQSISSGYPTTANNTLYYTQFTATAGAANYIHVYANYLDNYGVNTAVYTTAGVKLKEYYTADAGADGWKHWQLPSELCLATTNYLVGITHTRATSARMYRNPSATGYTIKFIAMPCDSSLENFDPDSASTLESNAAITITVNNSADTP